MDMGRSPFWTTVLRLLFLTTPHRLWGSSGVGHPNGERAQWVRNLEAAGSADVIDRAGAKTPVRAILLLRGPDRDAATEA
jgi:hypothetical protein